MSVTRGTGTSRKSNTIYVGKYKDLSIRKGGEFYTLRILSTDNKDLYPSICNLCVGDYVVVNSRRLQYVGQVVSRRKGSAAGVLLKMKNGVASATLRLRTILNVTDKSQSTLGAMMYPIDLFRDKLYDSSNRLAFMLATCDADKLFSEFWYEGKDDVNVRQKYRQIYDEYRFRQYLNQKRTVSALR